MNHQTHTTYPGLQSVKTGKEVITLLTKTTSDISLDRPVSLSTKIGLALTGQRVCHSLSAQDLVKSHDSLYAASGKHLPLVLNLYCSSLLKSAAGAYASHEAYHAVSDAGFFQLFARDVQEVADLSILAHKIAELALVPGLVAQDAFLTTESIESLLMPENELISEFLGSSKDMIDSPTPSQRMVFGNHRRRIPELWSLDQPLMSGAIQGTESYAQTIAANRTFYYNHLTEMINQSFKEYAKLTGRSYNRVDTYQVDDASYLIIGQGSAMRLAQSVADHLRKTKKIQVGVVNITLLRPFPGDLINPLLQGKKGVLVLERLDDPLAEDLPLLREIRFDNAPPLYSASFGMGGLSLNPQDLIAAIENMLPQGAKTKKLFLGVNYAYANKALPVQEIHQQAILESYPHLQSAAIHNQQNVNLFSDDTKFVRIVSSSPANEFLKIGEELATSLSTLLGYSVKGHAQTTPFMNQPASLDLAFGPEPIHGEISTQALDVLISLDDQLINRPASIKSLKNQGTLIVQSTQQTADQVWASFSNECQQIINNKNIHVLFIDLWRIIKDEVALKPAEAIQIQAKILWGCVIAATQIQNNQKDKEKEWKQFLKQKSIKQIFAELHEVVDKPCLPQKQTASSQMPVELKKWPQSKTPGADLHHFWAQTGQLYASSTKPQPLADPFIGTGIIPAATGTLKDWSHNRTHYPKWIPEKCTGCGICWMVCPDSALPSLVHESGEIFEAVISKLEEAGHTIKHLRKAIRAMDGELKGLIGTGEESCALHHHLAKAIEQTVSHSRLSPADKEELSQEFSFFQDQLQNFNFAITKPYYAEVGGGILSITLNPNQCKGCMECVKECNEGALVTEKQTDQSLTLMKKNWEIWLKLPNTNKKFMRKDELEQGKDHYHNLLLDKTAYYAMGGGDQAAPGSSQKTVLHLLTSIVDSIMREKIDANVASLDALIEKLEQHTKLRLSVNIGDSQALKQVLKSFDNQNFTLSELSEKLDPKKDPIDKEWLTRITLLLSELKHVRSLYTEGPSEKGRSQLGIVQSTDSLLGWSSTFPYNPFSFPWTHHLLEESPAIAIGLFEGYMKKIAEGFKITRMAELEIEGQYNPKEHDEFFKNFNWKQFTDDEWRLCPPLLVVGTEASLYGDALHNLNKLLDYGIPAKVVILDHLRSSPSLPLLGIMRQNTFVLQGGMGNISHMIKGFIEGLHSKRPALFDIFCSYLPETRRATDQATEQARLAHQSHLHPNFCYNPDQGLSLAECLNLEGNPNINTDPVTTSLNSVDQNGSKTTTEITMTYADFIALEGILDEHLQKIDAQPEKKSLVSVHDYLEMDEEERQQVKPTVYRVDHQGKLERFIVSPLIIQNCKNRREFWKLLQSLKRLDIVPVDEAAISERVQQEMLDKVTQALVQLSQGDDQVLSQ